MWSVQFNKGRCAVACASFSECLDISVLTVTEKRYYDDCKSEKRKSEYLAGRFLTKEILSRLTTITEPVSVLKSASGKPCFSPPYSNFSLSITHSQNTVAVIVFPAIMNYGIDLEIFNPKYLPAMRYGLKKYFPDIEQCEIEETTALWCLREAAYKVGIRESFSAEQGNIKSDILEICHGIIANTATSFKISSYGTGLVFQISKLTYAIVKAEKEQVLSGK